MAHLAGMQINTRRRSSVLAMAPPPTPSAKTLVRALVSLAKAVSSAGKPKVCQSRNASNVIRRIELMTALFEEVRDSDRPVPPTVVIAFRELHGLMQRIFILLEECRESSSFWLLMEQETYSQYFYELTHSLGSVLSSLPLDLLDPSEEVLEQTVLVRAQLVRARPALNPVELQLREDVIDMLKLVTAKGAPSASELKRIFDMLHLLNGTDCETEIHRLEELSMEEGKKDDPKSFGIAGLIGFVRYGKYVLYSAEFEGVEEEVSQVRSRNGVEGSSEVSTSCQDGDAAMVNPPVEYLCPITLDLMLDPVIVATGQTYDRTSITRWIQAGHSTCPKTGQKLSHKELISNFAVRSLIAQWCEDNNVPFGDDGIRRGRKKGAGMQHVQSTGVGLEAMKLTAALLCQKLATGNAHVQKQVARELRLLSKVGANNRICIAEAGGIPILLPLMSSSDAKTQEHAVTTLLNLSIVEDNKREIVAAGALDLIIEVLKSGHTMEARENAAAALFSLSVSDEVKVEIGSKFGAIPALVILLQEGSMQRGKRDAATALFNLAVYHGNKAKIIEAGAVPTLLALLGHESETVADACAAVLALLATSPEGVFALRDATAISMLVPLLRHGSPKAREYATSVLLAMCKSGDQVIIDDLFKHSTNIVQYLYHVLTTGTLRAKRKASALLKLLRSLQEPVDTPRIRQIVL
ncbi:hypothetical protein KC19_10G118300 [Ceratodon purpureus]|uniref:RING-type E3 ubiquitin transferase n=1 Tax=Ceratodon purpureus TaxID=3225 RepID=A0A8T0GJF4_CERPU|nr:hypothetical protein KC19_10G118300 [Ceratodon purpureus]